MTLAIALEILGLALRLAMVAGAVHVVGSLVVGSYLGAIVEPYSRWRRSR